MFAAIDIGSNTVRALVGHVDEGQVIPHSYVRQITRLGGGFCPERGLCDAAIDRTVRALVQIHQQLAAFELAALRVIATEAMRRAVNADRLVERVQQQTGFSIEIISGDEEARLSAAGILSALQPLPEVCLFFDLGGGSTEVGLVRQGRLNFFRSYPLGVVRQAEEQPTPEQRKAHIRQVLNQLKLDLQQQLGLMPAAIACVGTAGTVTTLAAIDQQMADYDWRKINNYRLSAQQIQQWKAALERMTAAERCAVPGMEEGRSDLIVPGCEIIQGLLEFCGSDALIVSDFGLLEGALLQLADPL